MKSTRKYTAEEKTQLVKNLDIEVEHRVHQLEEWLAGALENFRLHQEGLISRIPKLVREVTMGEFADKYNGDIQACLRGLQSERMGGTEFEIDKDTRKRKWAASQEEAEASGSGQGQEGDRTRATKNARMMTATPKKAAGGSSNPSRAFAASRTPGALRTTTRLPTAKPSPGPNKPARATSPSKQPSNATANSRSRPPSTATFNPTMVPQQAPAYPMRVNSITIRRDPSFTLSSSSSSSQSQSQPNERSSQTQSRTSSRARPPTSDATAPPSNHAPIPLASVPSSSASALVSIPTKDGHLLEFDPLITSPRALEKLVGITDSAKKQAKEEMSRLVKEAVRKWVID